MASHGFLSSSTSAAPRAPTVSNRGDDPPFWAPEDEKRGVIILARHGRPALDRSKSMSWRAYKQWWAAYDAGGLADADAPAPALAAVAALTHSILASPLRRSLETARAVARGRPIDTDPIFIEAPLPPPPVPGLRLKPGQWGVAARIAWWLGYAGGMESRSGSEQRAHAAVDRVEAEVAGGRVVLVCAHGWFNRMMRPVLQGRGWRCVRDGGDRYWGFRVYVRERR